MRVVLDRHVWRQGGGPSQLKGPLGLSQGPHAVQRLHPRHSRNGPAMNLTSSPANEKSKKRKIQEKTTPFLVTRTFHPCIDEKPGDVPDCPNPLSQHGCAM